MGVALHVTSWFIPPPVLYPIWVRTQFCSALLCGSSKATKYHPKRRQPHEHPHFLSLAPQPVLYPFLKAAQIWSSFPTQPPRPPLSLPLLVSQPTPTSSQGHSHQDISVGFLSI